MKNILVKFPSRSRPQKFLSTIKGYIANANNIDNIEFIISIDDDDSSMSGVKEELKEHRNIYVYSGAYSNKVGAINRDMDKALSDWDILVLASDDMIVQIQGWDDILRSEMEECFPDMDGVLWHNDGYVAMRLNTMCILGKRYYDRFGYIYHPEYTSLWCDNLFTDIANILGKQKYFPEVLFKHEHPGHTRMPYDAQYSYTESFYEADRQVYERHRTDNYKLILG